MKVLLLLPAVFYSLVSFTQQTAVIEWQNTIGGTDNEELHSIQQTADGGFILGGVSYSNGSGDKMENCIGMRDYWIVKTDAGGNIQWENTIGGTDEDILFSIEQTVDGGYILGGHSYSGISGDKTENCISGTYDFWIIKTDPSGNIQWQGTIGGNNDDRLTSVQQTPDGGYILGGSSWSNISVDKTENSIGSYGSVDFWILKTDATGHILWQNTIGGSDGDWLTSIHQTVDGGYILGGWSGSEMSGDKTENSIGGFCDFWMVKTNAIGNIEWQNTIGGSGEDHLYSIQQTGDGGYILGGYSNSEVSGDKSENSSGLYDYWIVKTDASGNIEWQNTIGGNKDDRLYSILQATDGGYILGGTSLSHASADKTEWSIGNDYWIVKTDAFGNIQWQNTIGGFGHDYLQSLRQTNDGGYILGGHSAADDSYDKTENSIGLNDYWIVKVNGVFNVIAGTLFIDGNSNNVQDVTEPALAGNKVIELNTQRFCISEQNGHYSVSVIDTGNFNVQPSPLAYYKTVPATLNSYFPALEQMDSFNDFAFQPTGNFNDVKITLSPVGPFRPGFNATYVINYTNTGTTVSTPVVVVYPDALLSFASASIIPALIRTDSIVWIDGSLYPFESRSITVTFDLSAAADIESMVVSSAVINPLTGDENAGDNYAEWRVIVTGSSDPNEILVDRDTVFTDQLANDRWLEYIIYFQNTGNDTAFNVKVMNPLPATLDISTFELVSASHPVHIKYDGFMQMEFQFDNILLPDSHVNEPLSHGYVRYRIQPFVTLSAGDTVINTANIIFDFNAPVYTNDAMTFIKVQEDHVFPPDILNVFPNPAATYLTITTANGVSMAQIEIRYLLGRVISSDLFQLHEDQNSIVIDVSALAAGVYIISLSSEAGTSSKMFVKQK